jgi:hypothetical protein
VNVSHPLEPLQLMGFIIIQNHGLYRYSEREVEHADAGYLSNRNLVGQPAAMTRVQNATLIPCCRYICIAMRNKSKIKTRAESQTKPVNAMRQSSVRTAQLRKVAVGRESESALTLVCYNRKCWGGHGCSRLCWRGRAGVDRTSVPFKISW